MFNLLLMRHAKSSWNDPSLADHDRPLNSRGKTDAPLMGAYLEAINQIPDVILCSSAKRARQTVEFLLQGCFFEGSIFYNRYLYHGGLEDYFDLLQQLDDQFKIAMIVGHNPGMEDAVEELCGSYESMPTASIAHLQLDIGSWSRFNPEITGKLVSVYRPKEI